MGFNNDFRKGDVILFDTDTNSIVKKYKNILHDVYSSNNVILAHVNGKNYIYIRDKINDVFFIKRFDLM